MSPRIGRRAILTVAAVSTMVGLLGSAAYAQEPVKLRFTWWGNDNRAKITQETIAEFEKANPGITIEPEFSGGGSTYWDRVATQVAANDEADIIQMDEQYIREYGARGALLDLTGLVDTSNFAAGTVETGLVDGKLLGINNGINAPTIVANPALFEAAGVPMPDDTTWTWDDYARIAAEITAKGNGVIGSSSYFASDYTFAAWLRQRGKSLFTDNGIGFDAADATEWFTMMQNMVASGAIPSAEQIVEDQSLSNDENYMASSKVAMASNVWTNQVGGLSEATGQDLKILRLPSLAGKANEAKLWYKASQYFSGSARTEHPVEVGKFIDFLVNSDTAAGILRTERGVPANLKTREFLEADLAPKDQKVIAYLDAIEPELGTPVAPPPVGSSNFRDVLLRFSQDVLFGNASPADAAQGLVDEVSANIAR